MNVIEIDVKSVLLESLSFRPFDREFLKLTFLVVDHPISDKSFRTFAE